MITSFIKRLFLFKLFLALFGNAFCQGSAQVSLSEQLGSLYDISRLPEYLSNTIVAQTSSYDTTGGNNDGFNGTYSFIRKDKDSNLVVFDIHGAGVINRIWTPTPSEDTLDFYIDDSTQASFSIRYSDLFSNKVFPFTRPLCGNELGGFYCYLPIPFQRHCKILCRARETRFHQIQYRLYPPGTRVKKFSTSLDEEDVSALRKVGEVWNKTSFSVDGYYQEGTKVDSSTKTIRLLPGETSTIFSMERGARIVGIRLDNAEAFEGVQKSVDMKITWDNERTPAVYCPVADFFGYAFGEKAMQSLLLGTERNTNYCYLPMPFDKRARIELIYRQSSSGLKEPLQCKAIVYYKNEPRDPRREGRLYGKWSSNQLLANKGPHVFLDARGRGHYVGSVLQAQGLQPGMTYFFEGDDSTSTDDVFRMHGTGSEDYFNGGWYAFPDRWSGKMSLPIHGALDYSLPFCRTGGYRFYLTDKIPFEKRMYHSIEHGPENNNMPVWYTSLAFYYCDRSPAEIQTPSRQSATVYVPDTLVMYPQLMRFTVWDNIVSKASWMYNTGGQTFSLSASDESRLRISLDEIPVGSYQLFADVTKTGKGCSFSLWQGQTALTDWISTAQQGKDERIPMLPIGSINVREFSRSLTIQFKTKEGQNNLLLSRIIFVRKQ